VQYYFKKGNIYYNNNKSNELFVMQFDTIIGAIGYFLNIWLLYCFRNIVFAYLLFILFLKYVTK